MALHDDPFPAFLHGPPDDERPHRHPTPEMERARRPSPKSWVSGALRLSSAARHPEITLPSVKWLEE